MTYARKNRLEWIDDESNTDCRFTRNYLRVRVMPAITQRFDRASVRLAAAAARFAEASELLDQLAEIDLQGQPAEFPLEADILRPLSESRVRNLLRAMIAWQGEQSPGEPRLREFARQLRSAGPDRRPRLDLASYSLWLEKAQIRFCKNH
jgi:tRNA(Ile)-lysidine synthase